MTYVWVLNLFYDYTPMNDKNIDKILWKLKHQSLIPYEWINMWWTTYYNCYLKWNLFLLKILCELLDVITS